jgi:ribosome recycling factor
MGRPSLLDRVMVDYYGTPTPLNQVAGVSVSGTQSLLVTPYDKGAYKAVETAILESGLGLMPNNEGRSETR